jgi:hypothetical protein
MFHGRLPPMVLAGSLRGETAFEAGFERMNAAAIVPGIHHLLRPVHRNPEGVRPAAESV